MRNHRGPVLASNLADDDEPGVILDPRRDLQQIRVFPESLRVDEVNAMLGEVSRAFPWAELESHNGIENIPFWEQYKASIWQKSLGYRGQAPFPERGLAPFQ